MKINQTIPVLPSANFDQTTQFYALLGFSQVNVYPDYLILKSGEQEMHFFLEEGDHTYGHGHSHFSSYIRALGLDDLYNTLESVGIITNPPAARPWGMKELELIDPDGSLLRFGEPLET